MSEMGERDVVESQAARCGVQWPVCSDCVGVGLAMTASWASCPSCGRSWLRTEVVPCPWAAAAELVDGTGKRVRVCASHAAHPSAAALQPDQQRFAPGDRVVWRAGNAGAAVRGEPIYAEIVREAKGSRDKPLRYLVRHPEGEAFVWADELERDPTTSIDEAGPCS